jgi:hypothetical protein
MNMERILVLFLIVMFGQSVNAIQLTPENYVDIPFTFDVAPEANDDAIALSLTSVTEFVPGNMTAQLFVDGLLLGSDVTANTGNELRRFTFVSETAIYPLNDPGIIDFEPLRSISVNALFRVMTDVGDYDFSTATSGASNFVLSIFYGETDHLGQSSITVGGSSYQRTRFNPPPVITIGDITTVAAVPIPAAIWLFISALIGLVTIRRTHR